MTEEFRGIKLALDSCNKEGTVWYNRISAGEEVYCYQKGSQVVLSDKPIGDKLWKEVEL